MFRPLHGLVGAAVHPGRAHRRWLGEPKPVGRALRTVAAAGVLYALTSLGLAASGAIPLIPLAFGLPDDNHYFWQMVFIVPAFVFMWLVSSGLLRLFGPRQGPEKRFRDAAALAGPSLAFPLIFAWIPQAVQTVLMILGMGQEEFVGIVSAPAIWQLLYLGAYAAAWAWAVLLFVFAARVSQAAGRLRAGISGVLVAAMVGILAVSFLR